MTSLKTAAKETSSLDDLENLLNNSKSVYISELLAVVASRKFDVLKTNICPRCEAFKANM